MKLTKANKIQINSASLESTSSYGGLGRILSKMLLDNGHRYIVSSSLMGGNKPQFIRYPDGAKHHIYPQRQTSNINNASSSSNDMVRRIETPDLMISIMNPRLLDPSVYDGINSIMWTPSETARMMKSDVAVLKHASAIWGMSKFVNQTIKEAMPNNDNIFYVPCAIDEAFVPKKKKESRAYLSKMVMRASLVNNPTANPHDPAYRVTVNDLQDAFIYCFVGANSKDPSRKDFYALMDIFASVLVKVPNAYLYLHTASIYGEQWAKVAGDLGIAHRIICPSMEFYDMNFFEPEDLAIIYSACDVSVTAEWGAGFGLPPVEGMACGTPFIGLEHSSLTEHTHPSMLVKCKPKYLKVASNHDGERWWSGWDFDEIAKAWINYAKSSQFFKDSMREWSLDYAQQYYPNNVYHNHIAPFFELFEFPYAELFPQYDIGLAREKWREQCRL